MTERLTIRIPDETPALIIEWPSGVQFTAQMNGGACDHAATEGVVIQLPFVHGLPFCACAGFNDAAYDRIEAAVNSALHLGCHVVKRIAIDRAADNQEAWIHCVASVEVDTGYAIEARDFPAILAYENCD